MRILRKTPLAMLACLGCLVSASPALAATHPKVGEFGGFTNPNGIAVDEATGDVYVADLGTNTVSKFDASGNPIESWGTKGVLDGSATPAGAFAFPTSEPGNPAAIAVDNSKSPSDPSAGDLYVMDAGHDVIDKFNAEGEVLTPITGPFSGVPLGLGVDPAGSLHVADTFPRPSVDVFNDSVVNSFVTNRRETVLNADLEITNEVSRYGFAAGGPTRDDYTLFSCGCIESSGPNGEELGAIDSASPAVAVAVDATTGHIYVDAQSSIEEWDTGVMNGGGTTQSGSFVSSFGSAELLSEPVGQGGIAVNGATGSIYVSNPAEHKVYVFATTVPAAAAGTPTGVTGTEATLHATVNPHGAEVTSCRFEYGTRPSNELTEPIANLDHSVPCEQTPTAIGAGTEPVAVSTRLTGLAPGSLYRFRLVAGNANGSAPSGGLFPTSAPAFGIKGFEVAFLNRDGTPDTQAGSHPYKILVNFEFNTQIIRRAATDLRYISMPVFNVKDVMVDLPPGLFGDTDATAKKCTLEQLSSGGLGDECPAGSEVGTLTAEVNVGFHAPEIQLKSVSSRLLSMVPPPGVPFQLVAHILVPNAFINIGLPAGGDSRLRATSLGVPVTAPIFRSLATVYGVPPVGATKPLITLPTACNGPLTSTVTVDSYQEPGRVNSDGSPDLSDSRWKDAESVTRNSAGAPGGMTGCAKLLFPPSITAAPDTTDASSSSGLTVGVHVSQKAALNPEGLAESTVRALTVTLPEGVAINPAGADGLEACSEGLAGFTGFTEFNPGVEPGDKTATFTSDLPETLVPPQPLQPGVNFCPDGSKIGTVKVKTPLLPNPLEGSVYLAAQNANPFGSLIAMYLIAQDPLSGTIIKQTGEVSLTPTGQIVTTFKNLPEDPFEDAELHFFGGERAPLTTPSHCGTYTTQASFTPWSGTAPVTSTSSFNIEHGPNESPCPGASLPFTPSLDALMMNTKAGEFSPLSTTFSREDGQQDLQAIQLKMPPGLSGLLSGVKLCGEAEANAGTCGPESEIGETIVSVGVGASPFSVKGGKVYITGPYKGAPFGLSIVNPAKAGPFDLGKVVVRAKIEVDPITTALTITTDNEGPYKIPQYIKGIPLQIKHVNVTITRPGFTFNPTNCSSLAVTGTISSTEGASVPVSDHFEVTNCAKLKFTPKFSASTSGRTSKANGASLSVKLTYPKAPFGSQANIAKVKVDLPKQLPSRLTTLQKACTAAQFKANPAGCPAASIVGYAKAITPLIPVPLEGPAYFVSNGGEAFPNLIVVLQGYGVTVDLVGDTFISKKGITSSTFKTVPDAPVGSFELTLPQRRFSALTANGNLCSATRTVITHKRVTRRVHGRVVHVRRTARRTVVQPLLMPTSFTAQNGAVLKQTTKIAVTGCPKKVGKHGKGKAKKKG